MIESDNDELPELNQKWFDKRFRAIRESSAREAEVELRCLIREIHLAVRFRDVKEARRRLDAQKETSVAATRGRFQTQKFGRTWAQGVEALEQP